MTTQQGIKNRWLIAASAVGIHLSIGSVYAWSVFAKPIISQCGWGLKDVQITFSTGENQYLTGVIRGSR